MVLVRIVPTAGGPRAPAHRPPPPMSHARPFATGLLAVGSLLARAQSAPAEVGAAPTDGPHVIECRLAERPRLSLNPTRETLGVRGLRSDVEMAFLSDVHGRTVLELGEAGRAPEWRLPDHGPEAGRYYLVLYSAGEWHSLAVEIE